MPITTMEQLAEVPVGAAVYVGDRKYPRVEEGWFGTEENPDRRMVRDVHFAGSIAVSKVIPEGEQEIKAGATAIGDNFWYYVKEVPTATTSTYSTIRIVAPGGERNGCGKTGMVENWNRSTTTKFLRKHLAPLPPEAEAYLRLALVGEIERLKSRVNEKAENYNTLYAQYTKEKEDWRAASSLNSRLRDVLREIAA